MSNDNNGFSGMGVLLPAFAIGAAAIGLVWTALTGSLVQWVPILAAIAIVVYASKSGPGPRDRKR